MSIQIVSKDNVPQTPTIVRDAVPGQLQIAIIGAGLVGLATAALLRKQGHQVTIFESSSFHAEIGAGIFLPPNGVGVLKNLLPELSWENMQGVDFRTLETFNFDGTHMDTDDVSEAWTMYPQGWFMIHRVDLHKEIMRLALDPAALAQAPATIRLGTPIKAVNFDPKRPSVITEAEEECTFDLVLGTDGIKSTVRKCMVGAEFDAPATQFGFYRWMVDLNTNPELSWMRDDRKSTGPTMIMDMNNPAPKVMGIFAYPIRRGNFINISVAHHDTRDPDTTGIRRPRRRHSGEAFEGLCDRFKGLVDAARNPRTWQVRKLPVLPTWIKGNVAILGDAAHAMWPTYGQGFAVGLEDAATIATLLPKGTKPSEIGGRLQIFEKIRKPRGERVSKMSTDDLSPPKNESFWIRPELLGYDPVAVTKAALAEA
ncbi:FAD/NAD(P)-binding domain-containing protein [Mycena sanguinolenta]|uniref:FAD/NAD(P)-binding domain-containing protein n=1 Tax=Mycena sanguinolenta TaxID=230812 RepID=A0A8H6XYG3_9AGAR|nr:FAD/NAD(P)-binding domain-containing protein [Mycena sanguinolenta]